MLPVARAFAEPGLPMETSDERRGKEAVRADEEVVPASEARKLEDRVRELERLLGRKTMEVEILKEALDLARVKKPILAIDGHWGDETTRQGSHSLRGRPSSAGISSS
jgi:hypothetical protein